MPFRRQTFFRTVVQIPNFFETFGRVNRQPKTKNREKKKKKKKETQEKKRKQGRKKKSKYLINRKMKVLSKLFVSNQLGVNLLVKVRHYDNNARERSQGRTVRAEHRHRKK